MQTKRLETEQAMAPFTAALRGFVQTPVRLATAVGVVTGIADALVVQTNLDGSRFIPYPPLATWTVIPLAWLTLCLLAAAIFSVGFFRRYLIIAVAVAGPGILLLSRGVPIARRALGLEFVGSAALVGFIVVVGAAVSSRLSLYAARFDRAAAVLALVGILFLGAYAATPVNFRRPDAAVTGNGMNVVVIVLDTARYDDASQLPAVRRLAGEAADFKNAWAPSSWTLPSHFAVMTGLDPWSVPYDRDRMRFEPKGLTMAQVLGSHGYSTAAIFANPLLRRGSGVARGLQRADVAESCVICAAGMFHLTTRVYYHVGSRSPFCDWYAGPDVTARAVDFIERAHRPYFLALNYMEAHSPYFVDPWCGNAPGRISDADFQQLLVGVYRETPVNRSVLDRVRRQYLASLRCLDRSIGPLLDHIRVSPDANRTVIALIADHGEQFGEHSLIGHGNSVYSQVLHVPMVVKVPGRPAEIIIEPVSITDLYPTLLNAVGIDAGKNGLLAPQRRPACAYYWRTIPGLPPAAAFSVARSKYHVIKWQDGREQVFAYRTDPEEAAPLGATDDLEIEGSDQIVRRLWQSDRRIAAEFNALGYIQ